MARDDEILRLEAAIVKSKERVETLEYREDTPENKTKLDAEKRALAKLESELKGFRRHNQKNAVVALCILILIAMVWIAVSDEVKAAE